MSNGSQIGGIVGGIIGAIITRTPAGFQYGYMIGAGIGAYVDPTKVQGPRLDDSAQQTSTVGGPIPFGYGMFTVGGGNIIWTDKLVEREHHDSGKGMEVDTFSYHRSYAVGVCEGPINGYEWIKRNGKFVYARDPDALGRLMGWSTADINDLKEARNKFLREAKLYLGTDDQMPDSTIVAIEGVGNVSPFRNLAYIVMKDEDVTDMRGAVSQFEFCVSVSEPVSYLTAMPPSPLWELLGPVPGAVWARAGRAAVYGNELYHVAYLQPHYYITDVDSGAYRTVEFPVPNSDLVAVAVEPTLGTLLFVHHVGGISGAPLHFTLLDRNNQVISSVAGPALPLAMSSPDVAVGYGKAPTSELGYWTVSIWLDGWQGWTSTTDDPTVWPAYEQRFAGGRFNIGNSGLHKTASGWLMSRHYFVTGTSDGYTRVFLMSFDGASFSEVYAVACTDMALGGADLIGEGYELYMNTSVPPPTGFASVKIRLHSFDGGGTWGEIYRSQTAPIPISVAKGSTWYGSYRPMLDENVAGVMTTDGVTPDETPFFGEQASSLYLRLPNGGAVVGNSDGYLRRTSRAWESL